jgi:hypothetical protein
MAKGQCTDWNYYESKELCQVNNDLCKIGEKYKYEDLAYYSDTKQVANDVAGIDMNCEAQFDDLYKLISEVFMVMKNHAENETRTDNPDKYDSNHKVLDRGSVERSSM